jgi:MFS family permease
MRARGRLWGQPEFLKLWGGQTISVFGDQITMLALPLAAVLLLDASAAQMGLLTAAGWAPHLLFALAAGLWIDRRRSRRRVMVATDVGRALVLATVPLAYWLDALTIEHLVVAAFAVGALTVFFDIAWSTLFVRVVPREDVVEANSKLSTTRAASFVGGPAIAGFIVQVLSAPVAILADALSFLGSALLIGRIRVDEPELEPTAEPIRARLASGFRFVFGHQLMRATLGCTATINFFNLAFFAIVVLFLARELDLSPATIGIALAVGAAGGLVGALAAPAIGRRLGIGPAIVVGAVLFPAPLLLFPLASGPEPVVIAMVVVGEFLSSVGVMVFDVHANSLGVLITPERMRPRQVATFRFINYGVRPLGALAGGFLAASIGLRPALFVAALGALGGVLWLLGSPMPRVREAPARA